MSRNDGHRLMAVLVSTLMAAAVPTAAAATCPPPDRQPLQQPPELRARNGVLDTSFTIKLQPHDCVPFWDKGWTTRSLTLRTYGFPATPGSPQLTWSTPGPTLRVRRATSKGAGDGDRLRILLDNQLPPNSVPPDQCDPACRSAQPECCPPPGSTCPTDKCPRGCPQERFPECFHGSNNTNLHFHGSHVSPQSPQDYILLELQPAGTAESSPHAHAHTRGTAAVGEFQYSIDPFPWNQAEGTHWYHPHKHGSVALQVLNGMAGALIIEGPFDDWLSGFYKAAGGLSEMVLVIQQLDSDLNFFRKSPNYAPPHPLINGQANPVITMAPGEIQRWRFVGATMQGAAQLTIGFAGRGAPQLRQIAQDGVQFAPENYARQPLLAQGAGNFKLSPGNRADFLVQAPTTPGTHVLSFSVFGLLEGQHRERVEERARALAAAAAAGNPPLLTVNVAGAPKPMGFPTPQQWPAMPSFLADVKDGELTTPGTARTIVFSMTGNPGGQPNAFYINDKQFDPSCVDETMRIGSAEQWSVQNSSTPNHPFHIHTNPFQITQVNGQDLPAPWVWWDTVALPSVNPTQDFDAGPIWNNDDAKVKCPGVCKAVRNGTWIWNGQWTTTVPEQMSVCGCVETGNGSITTRSRFEDYTGEYVIHCHFLGHEDRGMMIGVQTVCPSSADVWGQPVPGRPDDCAITSPGAPRCTASAE